MSAQQNLVPNGSFEDTLSCPNNAGQVNYSTHWFDPTKTSSDYFNSCCTNNIAGVPNNVAGFKYCYNGNAMMGLATYFSSSPNYREYIAVKLNEKLDSNVSYCISFYVSPSGSCKYSSNGLGIGLLSDTIGIYSYYFNTIILPETFVDTTNIIDTSKWSRIEIKFINKKYNSQYLIFGNFYNDSQVNTSVINNSGGELAYYYIDKVELVKCEETILQIPNVITPNNDGINDTWQFDLQESANCIIYNRWGIKVFETHKQFIKWDGRTTSGESCSAGTYYYIIQTETEIYKGFLEIFK
jgi:gliding motility-associated-like protein